MKYEFERIIPKKAKCNKWVLVIKFMHGDADAYTKEKILFKDEDSFKKCFQAIKERLDYKREFHNAAINSNDDWCREQEDWLESPGDCTSFGEFLATPESFKAFYYDNVGQKFRVIGK